MTRVPLFRRAAAAALVSSCVLAAHAAPTRKGKKPDGFQQITKDDVVKGAAQEFEEVREETRQDYPKNPEFLGYIDKTQDYFNAHANGELTQPNYHRWELNMLSRVVGGVIIPGFKDQFEAMNAQSDEQRDVLNQQAERNFQVRMAGVAQEFHADLAKQARQDGSESGTAGAVDGDPSGHDGNGDGGWGHGGHPNIDELMKNSQVLRLGRESAANSIPHDPPNGGGGGSTPNNGGGGGSSGKSGGNGASSNGGAAAPDDWMNVIKNGAASAMAAKSGQELDKGDYSAAYAHAQQALQLDPANREAKGVIGFAAGRVDGVASAGPAPSSAGAGERGFAGGGAAGGRASFGGFVGAGGGKGGAGALGPSSGASSRLSAEQAEKAAMDAIGLRDYHSALDYANRALAADPNNVRFLNIRADAYAHLHDYSHSLADAKAALALAPGNPTLMKRKGLAELRGGQYKDALASANALIEANPNDSYGYALRAQAYARLGDRDAYLADIRRAAELDPYYQEAAAHPSDVQKPSDSDLLFLFPGEDGPKTAAPAAPGRGRQFSWIVGASLVGGLLLAFGLLQTVLAPLKEKASSVFTRVTRTGPRVGALADDGAASAGLIRGQYEITRPIGQGGMGMVYEGTDRSLGRRVAIKKMRDELRADPRERARFVAEAKTVAALHHPNVVDIYAIADEGSEVFLVFEYVDGKTVHDLVQSRGKLGPEQVGPIVGAAADALEYAHSRGVIHRDMKPSNVMVDGAGRVKVMDFGIARLAKDALTRYSMTNTVVGTPPYMAPEQEQGQVRRESDVYSLAICAYEMLTGRLPFAGVGGGMLLNKINMSFVPLSREVAGLPPALDAVFERAFQADPEKRYRTPREFSDALRSALGAAVRAA